MPLDLTAIARQARRDVPTAAAEAADLFAQVSSAVGALRNLDTERLRERRATRHDVPWLTAEPTEPPSLRKAAPVPLTEYAVVATDGSHVDQDHHDALPHWLINLGLITLRYGDQPSAQLATRSELGIGRDALYYRHDGRRHRIQGQVLNVRRQVAEAAALAELCEASPGAAGLIDGTLVLSSISRSTQPEPTAFLTEYLAALDRVESSGGIIAAYISQPSGSDVVASLRIGCCDRSSCDPICRLGDRATRPCGLFPDVLDRHLFAAMLEAGERSAIWRSGWPTSQRYYGRHAVHFFYFDTGVEVCRVEIPAWVALDPTRVDRLHAVLCAQCDRGDDGYPRALIEAHHLAVVTAGDRRALDTVIDNALTAGGIATLASAKQRAKRLRAV
ncbi:MAG: DNA double-strand break repair nuclease NurA [Chloroflexota bacterium]|nr:MAG: DNA double-strand break repair nuclease NurA [Chloroflexota bacterium]